jgi:hypothetical protein
MTATITIEKQYEFAYYWTLHVEEGDYHESFYLGQDVKFSQRVLGMEPKDVVKGANISDLISEENKEKLAWFIIEQLDLSLEKLKGLKSWQLCAE